MQKRIHFIQNASPQNSPAKNASATTQIKKTQVSYRSGLTKGNGEEVNESKLSLSNTLPKLSGNTDTIILNVEDNHKTNSGLSVGNALPNQDKPAMSSFVAAFSKPATNAHERNGKPNASESVIQHVESCKLNETGKRAHVISDYTDLVTRFCKPSSERSREIARTESNYLPNEVALSSTKKYDEEQQKPKMKMDDSNEVKVIQRSMPPKSVSAVDIKLNSAETNKKNTALIRGRRINTVNLPGDNKNRILARKMPLRRPRRRKDSSSSLSSNSDGDLSPVREQSSINKPGTNTKDASDKVFVKNRVRSRNRRRGSSSASDNANIISRPLQNHLLIDSQMNERLRQNSNQEGLANETTNSLKCYFVTENVDISRSKSSTKASDFRPADRQSSNTSPSCKQSQIVLANQKETEDLMSNKNYRSFTEDKLIINSEQISAVKDNVETDINNDNHCTNAHDELTNQRQVPKTNNSSVDSDKKKFLDARSEVAIETKHLSNLEEVQNEATFDQHKQKQNYERHMYENVTVVKNETNQARPGNLLIAKKVSVSYWPTDEATKKLLNANAGSKAKAVSDLYSIAKENSMIQEAMEKDYLKKLTKETNLSDSVHEPMSEAPQPPRRRPKQSHSFHHGPASKEPRSTTIIRSNTDRSKRDFSNRMEEVSDQKVVSDLSLQNKDVYQSQLQSRNYSNERHNDDQNRNFEDHTTIISNEINKTMHDIDHSSLSFNESQIFATTTVSTRKSSVVSQSTALKPSQTKDDSDDSGDVDEGFTEEIQEKVQRLNPVSDAFSGNWRRKSQHNADSKSHSVDPSHSHSDFSTLAVRPENELGRDDNEIKFSAKQVKRTDHLSDRGQNSDSDLSGCSDSSSLEDEIANSSRNGSSARKIFDSESSFKVPLKKKKSFSDPNTNAVYTAGLLRRNKIEQGDSFNSYAKRHSESSSELYGIDKQGPALSNKTKTFRAKERKYADEEDFKSSKENLFQPIKQADVSSDSMSPTDNSSLEDSLEHKEEEFREVLQTMSLSQDNRVHEKSLSEPVQDYKNAEIPRIPERTRRSGVVRTFNTNGDISYSKPYSEYNKYHQERKKTDLRKCVVTNLLETEEGYVSSLRKLMENYLKPLKQPVNQNVSELQLVDDVIFQVSQLLHNHQQFSAIIRERYEDWNSESKIGELFIETFNKDMLLKSYTNYVNNFNITKEVIYAAIDSNTAFRTLLEQSQRDSKQGLADLMIKPVQRVPRYELLIKDLLKHTHSSHLDYEYLLTAQKDIHSLAVQMNKGEKEAEAADRHTRLLQEIEQLIEASVEAISIPKRKFIQQEFCFEQKSASKKERSLWLFNDMLMGTTVKKGKSSSLRRSTMNLMSLLPEDATVDTANRYKYLWKYPLSDLDVVKGTDKQIQSIQDDMKLLSDIETMASRISIGHDSLSSLIKDMKSSLDQQMQEKERFLPNSTLPSYQSLSVSGSRLEIRALSSFGMKCHQFEFFNEESRQNFERLLVKAKDKYMVQKSQWGPSLLKVIPISKTRNGMQFSCASSNVATQPGTKEVWVCNTDGHVGQICFLTVESDPQQTQCLTVCNAKICCIAQVPAYSHHKLVPTPSFINAISKTNLDAVAENRQSASVNDPAKTIMAFDESDESDDNNKSPYSTLGSVNSTSSFDIHAGNDVSANDHSTTTRNPQNNFMQQLMGSAAYKKDSNGSTLHGSLEDLLSDGSSSNTSVKKETSGTMWVGTEDGSINIFSTSEPIRASRHGTQYSHNAAVLCILPHQNQVFVALSNGDLIVYQRDIVSGQWDYNNKKCISGASSSTPITKMVVVNENELWCGCQNEIRIINIKTHDLKSFFSVVNDKLRQIFCMVALGYGVWLAMDKNPTIKLFHSVTHDLIAEVDVTSSVNSMLAGSDAIIRQHKLACLRVTSLLVCKNSLWAGTSAGVVLTVPLPNVTPHTTPMQLDADPQSLGCGHTGHVRFLTEMEVTEPATLPGKGKRTPGKRRISAAVNQTKSTTLVVSGGDGFEDFGGFSTNNKAGKEDSTNHLLIWKI